MKISYTKFTHISKAMRILLAVKYGCHWANLYKTHVCWTTSPKKPCTKFHENSTNYLIADTKLDVDGCTDRPMVRCVSIQGIHFHFVRNLHNLNSETGKGCCVTRKCTCVIIHLFHYQLLSR